MAGLDFRIGTKLGLTAGITAGLVVRMHANQFHGHSSIEETSRSVSASHSSAQGADSGMMRAPPALHASSVAEFDQGPSASAPVLASACLLPNESGPLETDVENFPDTVRAA